MPETKPHPHHGQHAADTDNPDTIGKISVRVTIETEHTKALVRHVKALEANADPLELHRLDGYRSGLEFALKTIAECAR